MKKHDEEREETTVKNVIDIIYYIIMSIITFFSLVDMYISVYYRDDSAVAASDKEEHMETSVVNKE